MSLAERLVPILKSPRTQNTIVALILLNAVTLGLETAPSVMERAGGLVKTLDHLILALFTLEVVAKLYVYRREFWRDAWNVFDFIVVGIALVPASGPFSVLRVLRLLRLVRMVPKLRFIVEALLRAIPGIVSIFGLLMLVFYVFAIIATNLFGVTHPEWFGTLGASMYTLFQVMTLESWSMGIARPVMDIHPWAWAFFIPFILVSTFTVLNLFIAIIVDAMQRIETDLAQTTTQEVTRAVHSENLSLHTEIAELREQSQRMQERLAVLLASLERENAGAGPVRVVDRPAAATEP